MKVAPLSLWCWKVIWLAYIFDGDCVMHWNSEAAKWCCQLLNYARREQALQAPLLPHLLFLFSFLCEIFSSINLLSSLSKQYIASPSSERLA